MRTFKVTWKEKRKEMVVAKDADEALELAALTTRDDETCLDQYDFEVEDEGLVEKEHDDE